MALDALNPPNSYTEVTAELTNMANIRSAAYMRMYLTRDFRIGSNKITYGHWGLPD